MGNQDLQKELEFLTKAESAHMFNKMYDTLRKGVHIHRKNLPDLFHYIQKYEDSISAFLKHFNETNLIQQSQQSEKYYFIDYMESSRSKSSIKFMDNSTLTVGFLLYRIYYQDVYEVETISDFQRVILESYPEYRKGIMKNLALTESRDTGGDEEIVLSKIKSAFNEFKQIGWIELNGDFFKPYPAFERIIYNYRE
jgi:chromosome condensin MukBEF MukE localization factor